MEMDLLNSRQFMVGNAVELWEFMMNVARNVVTAKKLCRKILFVEDATTISVLKYVVMEKFIKKMREQPVVVSKPTKSKHKSVARIVLLQNSSAKESGTGEVSDPI